MGWIFSLLGLGGIGGIMAMWFMVPAFPLIVGRILTAIPPKVLYALLGVIALTFAVIWHGHEVKQVKAAAFTAGRTAGITEMRASYDKLKAAFDLEAQTSQKRAAIISETERQLHEQDLRRNALAADDLRLRGPGKAAARICRPDVAAGLPGRPGGPQITPAAPSPAGPEMPTGDREAVVPWGWLVRTVQEHDDALDENAAWRRWYPQQAAEFDRLKREIPSPEFGHPSPTP